MTKKTNTYPNNFGKPLKQYRAKDAVNAKPTISKQEMIAEVSSGLVKTLEAIDSDVVIPACIEYLIKHDYQTIRTT